MGQKKKKVLPRADSASLTYLAMARAGSKPHTTLAELIGDHVTGIRKEETNTRDIRYSPPHQGREKGEMASLFS